MRKYYLLKRHTDIPNAYMYVCVHSSVLSYCVYACVARLSWCSVRTHPTLWQFRMSAEQTHTKKKVDIFVLFDRRIHSQVLSASKINYANAIFPLAFWLAISEANWNLPIECLSVHCVALNFSLFSEKSGNFLKMVSIWFYGMAYLEKIDTIFSIRLREARKWACIDWIEIFGAKISKHFSSHRFNMYILLLLLF